MFRKTATELKIRVQMWQKQFQPKKKKQKKTKENMFLKHSNFHQFEKKNGHLATKKTQKTLKFRQFENKKNPKISRLFL
jgi:hypothetical protein